MASKPEKNPSKKSSKKNKNSGAQKKEKIPYLDREIQWLEFNARVLHEAEDLRTPLLERLHFLGIVTSNLDEFVMKRVGGLKRQIAFGIGAREEGEQKVTDKLVGIRQFVKEHIEHQSKIYKDLLKDLSVRNIHLKKWTDLSKKEKVSVSDYYKNHIFPVLTPLVVDPALPFPFISNLCLSLGVGLRVDEQEELLFARVKVPEVFPQWIPVETDVEGDRVFVSLVQVIQHNLHDLFPNMEVVDVMPFRVTRNADLERDEEDAEDLLELITEELKQRRFAEAVRLEHGTEVPWMVTLLKKELELENQDVYHVKGLLDYGTLKTIWELKLPHMKFEHWEPQVPAAFYENPSSFFEVIKRSDVLVHHPYDSFKFSVERMIRVAAEDPDVVAIKMTLYRMGDKNPIIDALIQAAEQGKQVVCIIELKARFDEKRNIYWAQQMEKAGIHVVYGVVGFKVHSKTTLVLRQEKGKIVSYGHVGTGNYNNVTARFYTDVGLLTADPGITQDLVRLFHMLTSRSFSHEFKDLLVAPLTMRGFFEEAIEQEIKNAQEKRPAHIIAKFNSLEDKRIIRKLYEASRAGVKVDLIVRGFCCLAPGLKGWSENIRVISVIGRFLEHSRIFYFRKGHESHLDGDFYIGSGDWMYRNLNRRVEVATPIKERTLRRRCWEAMDLALKDKRQAWQMKSDGSYVQFKSQSADQVGSQKKLMDLNRLRVEEI